MKILETFKNKSRSNHYIDKPYLIAEAGVNHEGDLGIARRLISEAAESGANAIKFQTYKANTIASKFSPAYWDLREEPTDSQYALFKRYDKFWKKEFELLKTHCEKESIEFLSTPFDIESANFLNDMMDVFKVSSSDITNKPFIEYITSFGKPLILSTGASYMYEIHQAVEWIDAKHVHVALMHCILNYPTLDKNTNLGMIKDLQQKFPDKVIGYSDHTLPRDMKVLEMATMLGATILEKHFTHDKSLKGNDHYHAMDKHDVKEFKKNLEDIFLIIGDQKKYSLNTELPARENARRSLVAKENIPEGKEITREELTWKRPAHGISPKDIDQVVGRMARCDIMEDDLIKWDKLK